MGDQGCQKVLKKVAEFSKLVASPGIFYLKNILCIEMPSRVASQY